MSFILLSFVSHSDLSYTVFTTMKNKDSSKGDICDGLIKFLYKQQNSKTSAFCVNPYFCVYDDITLNCQQS